MPQIARQRNKKQIAKYTIDKARGGSIFGEGGLATIVDSDELGITSTSKLVFYSYDFQSNEFLPIKQEDIPKDIFSRIVFKKFKNREGHDLPAGLDYAKTLLKKYIAKPSLIVYRFGTACLAEIAHHAIVVKITENTNEVYDTPIFIHNDKNYLFVVMDNKYIYPILEKYDNDAGKVHLEPSFSFEQVLQISEMVLRFTSVLHDNGYYHYDIKPENILYRKDESNLGFKFVLSDFGQLGTYGQFVGTPYYQSPLKGIYGHNVAMNYSKMTYKDLKKLTQHLLPTLERVGKACQTPGPIDVRELMGVSAAKAELDSFVNTLDLNKDFWRKWFAAIEKSLDTLQKVDETEARTICTDVGSIEGEVIRLIEQKHELFAIGLTIEQIAKHVNMTHEQSAFIKEFVKKLVEANIFTTGMNKRDFYYCSDAYAFLEEYITNAYD